MKLDITITLTAGGTIHIFGEDLSGEDVTEVFKILSDTGHTFDGSIDPQNEPITESMKESFVAGFDEGRTEEEKP